MPGGHTRRGERDLQARVFVPEGLLCATAGCDIHNDTAEPHSSALISGHHGCVNFHPKLTAIARKPAKVADSRAGLTNTLNFQGQSFTVFRVNGTSPECRSFGPI